MLDLMGSGYVIDHVIAEHNRLVKEEAYRNYTSDVLRLIAQSWGMNIHDRYADMIERPNKNKEKTGDEIAIEVIKRIGLKGKHNESTGFSSEDIS